MDAKALVRIYFEDIFTHNRLERAEEIAAVEYVEHAAMPFATEEPGLVQGPEHLRSTASWLRAQFPDLRMEIERVVAEADAVAVLVASSGTNQGELNGVMPPTGRPGLLHAAVPSRGPDPPDPVSPPGSDRARRAGRGRAHQRRRG
ncbi:MAG TPA: ester cyclase [Nocardioidaceae bacterium]|nr:ester cyclase [Nocardioidaceae bacterium]